LKIYYTNQFKRDYKRVKKQHKDITKLRTVIDKLVAQEPLEVKYKDHPLMGKWKEFRDCHLEPADHHEIPIPGRHLFSGLCPNGKTGSAPSSRVCCKNLMYYVAISECGQKLQSVLRPGMQSRGDQKRAILRSPVQVFAWKILKTATRA